MPKILAIDDKTDNLITLSALLKALIPDCEVLTAQSGPEGIEKARAESPDTILLDIKMPGMDGYEVCKSLKDNESTKHIPVIMISAIKTESKDLVKGLETGADAYLAKPIDEYALAAQVKTALRIKKAEDQLRNQKDFLEEMVRERTGALRESEEKYRNLVEESFDGIFIQRGQSIIFANKRLNEMLGYEEGELIGQNHWVVYHPDYQKLTRERAQARMRGEEVMRRYEVKLQRKDGSWFYGEINAKPITSPSDKESGIQVWIKDIMEQKLAEGTLRESEDKYRSLFEESRDAIVLTTQQGKFIDANPAALELFGYTKEEILKMNFQKLYVDPDEGYRFQKEMKEKDSVQDFETKLRRKDDVEMDCIFDVVCRQGDDGKILKYQGIIRDISEAKRAQEALRTSQQRLSQIINFLPDATFVIDNEGKVVTWNHAMERMTGVKAEEILGKGNHEYAVPFYGERRPTLIDLASKWNKATAGKYQYVKKEGESLVSETYDSRVKPGGFLRNKASLLYDSAGEVMGAIESIRDITDRKVAEGALQESEDKYRLLVENANDAIFVAQDGVIKFPNARTEELTGYSAEELNKIPFVNHIHPDDREMVIERHKKRLEGEDLPSSYPYRAINKTGEELWHLLNSVPVTWEGRPATLNFVRDITEAKRLEAQFEQANKMDAIATLAGGVAHEFNNALMGIMGNIELLKMDLPEDEGRDKYFDPMKSSGHRMSRLTDQLLAYAQGGKYQPKHLKLDDFMIQTLPILQHDIKPSVRVETHFSKDIPYIKADYAQMQMVLSAILANSNEAIEDEGLIRITGENKDVDEDFTKQHPNLKPTPYVCLTIEDDGKGMDEETRKGIFEPFFTTKFQGRGMAMAAVYGIVMNHDGWIYVGSELGKGTVVQIYLPAVSAESKAQGAKALKQPEVELATGEGTILMIEDEDVVIKVTQAILERLGYRVMVAKTGKDAIHITETFDGRIDLALLDIKLPDMQGGKVYPLIMKARPDLKVIVFSGYAIEGPARKILDAGAQDFIQKPFSIAELAEKLKEVLEGQTSLGG